MKISVFFHSYIRANGPQQQKCMKCGALHDIDEKNNVRLKQAGTQLARLSQEYPYPEYKPFRIGPYRVRFSNGNWAKSLVTWDADNECWRDGPVLFHTGSIIAWQGLAGDMEHIKRMPYMLGEPLDISTVEGDDE